MKPVKIVLASAIGTLAAGLLFAAVPARPQTAIGPAARQVVQGNRAFACELFKQLGMKPGNLFYSPFSISAALGMTSLGARGQTLSEMLKTLHLPDGLATPEGFAELLPRLKSAPDSSHQLHVANALWGQQGYPFRKEFLAQSEKFYGAGLRTVDFAHFEQARSTINRWVEEQTRNRIKDLLPPGSITHLSRLVLTNAIYFKGDWARQFPKSATRDEPFQLSAGRTVPAPLMRLSGHFPYAEHADWQALSLPYKGDTLSMVVILPKQVDGLAALEAGLTGEQLETVLTALRRAEGDVHLPRFKMTSEFDLGDTLQAMGIKQAFSRSADFTGLADGGERLEITKVVHKAFVEVNEEGSEAAAATGVVVGVRSAAPGRPPQRFNFRADHPFLFLIRDNASGSVLFLGRVANPAS